MKRLALALLSAGTVLTPSAAVPARAGAFGPGLLCGMATVTDPTAEPHTQIGALVGGPILTSRPSTMTCTVQVECYTHDCEDDVVARGPSATGVVLALRATPLDGFAYSAVIDDLVFVCTQVEFDGTTYYWDDAHDGVGGGSWTTSSSSACQLAIPVDVSEALDPLAPVVCPILGNFFPVQVSRPLQIQAGCVEGEGQIVRLAIPFPTG